MKAASDGLCAGILASALMLTPWVATAQTSQTYLFDLLDQPAHRKAWNALFEGEEGVDAWLSGYAESRSGPANAGKLVTLGGVAHQVNTVCKAHACGDNLFVVLFSADGSQAWGLLLKDGKTERYFGHPDEQRKAALKAATRPE
ncbi:MAG: hypothetical protein KDF54_06205 [Hydrogenophaga sp.]|nr:hypothetical protein [Hydrogenophaga sp.]